MRQRESETDRGRKISVIQQHMLRTAHGHEPQLKSQLNYSVNCTPAESSSQNTKAPIWVLLCLLHII